ncbi:MAG: tetratricopeptide repeat protein, partial [Fibrobacterota bacterium]
MQKQAAETNGSFEEEEVSGEEKDLNRSSYFFVEAKNLERQRDFHKAYELYKGAWKYDPHSEYLTELLREYAVQLHKSGDALYFITEGQALSELPDSTVRQVIGVYDRMDNYQQMIFAFEEIDSLSFYDSLLYVNALENSGHYMQAVEMYKRIQNSETVDSLISSEEEFSSMDKRDFYIQIGDLYAKNEMYDSALVYYDSVPDDSPLRLPARRGRALALYEQGEYVDSAVQLMESVHDIALQENVFYPVLTEVLARHYAYEENDFIRGIEILTPLYEYVKDRENTSLILY